MNLEVFAASSLEKIFPDDVLNIKKLEKASILKDEVFSFSSVSAILVLTSSPAAKAILM